MSILVFLAIQSMFWESVNVQMLSDGGASRVDGCDGKLSDWKLLRQKLNSYCLLLLFESSILFPCTSSLSTSSSIPVLGINRNKKTKHQLNPFESSHFQKRQNGQLLELDCYMGQHFWCITAASWTSMLIPAVMRGFADLSQLIDFKLWQLIESKRDKLEGGQSTTLGTYTLSIILISPRSFGSPSVRPVSRHITSHLLPNWTSSGVKLCSLMRFLKQEVPSVQTSQPKGSLFTFFFFLKYCRPMDVGPTV